MDLTAIQQDEYNQIMRQFEECTFFADDYGVNISRTMLDKLSRPAGDIPYIHVAGTNGKGSVCAFLTSMLMELGYKVGTFTSPHLYDYEERICVNRRKIDKAEVCRIARELTASDWGVKPTYFDYSLMIAMKYFEKKQCDILVIETGMGGRFDSTNALNGPVASVITKIGYDHMAILGDTLEKIAYEKAGIIRKNTPVVCERQETAAMRVIVDEYCRLNDSNQCNHDNLIVVNDEDINRVSGYSLKLQGVHQWENAACAYTVIETLMKNGIITDISRQTAGDTGIRLRRALEDTYWPARMEVLSDKPFLMIDGAHNSHGVSALCESLKTMYPNEKFRFFVGVMADKDYENMIKCMLPIAYDFATCTPENKRALAGHELSECIRENGVNSKELMRIEDIFDELDHSKRNIVFGSLYFVAEVKKAWDER